jgi:hypothetical protein
MLLYFDSNVARNINYKSVGGSIRCLMDWQLTISWFILRKEVLRFLE